jgi:hypothetical protein
VKNPLVALRPRLFALSLGAAILSACTPNAVLEALSSRPEPATPPAWNGTSQSLRIPGGEKCLEWLEKLGIEHQRLPPQPGVQTPVDVGGPIGGVRYLSQGKQSVVADCRLILALDWIAPSLRAQGITAVQHSGAYVYRTQKSGLPSLHARGLAIDVHALRYPDERVLVERDFARGLGDGCETDAPKLNRLTCSLRRIRLFQELITPDHDTDHHDHVHLAISPRDDHS